MGRAGVLAVVIETVGLKVLRLAPLRICYPNRAGRWRERVIGYKSVIAGGFTATTDDDDARFAHLTEGGPASVFTTRWPTRANAEQPPGFPRRVLITIAKPWIPAAIKARRSAARRATRNITIYSIGLSTTVAEVRGKPRESTQSPITPPGTFAGPPAPGTIQTPSTEARALAATA